MTVLVDNREKPETIQRGRAYPSKSLYGYIYKIENKVNGKVYIDQTTQKPERRRNKHFKLLRGEQHFNNHLQNAFNHYGDTNFNFSILNWALNRDDLNKQERYFINKYDCLNSKHGYNLQSGGNNGKASLETRKRMSEAQKGENHHRYGKHLSEGHRQKLSEAHKGKKHSEESRKKMSEAHKDKGLFGFNGGCYSNKNYNPWTRVWWASIRWKGNTTSLGVFNDPLSCEIVFNIVRDELYG